MKPIIDKIEEAKYELQKMKFVLEKYPDAKYFYDYDYKNKIKTLGFCAKSINTDYTHLEFLKDSHSLYVMPSIRLTFKYNNKEEEIKIFSSPKQNRLAYIMNTSSVFSNKKSKVKSVMKFSRFVFNLKKHNFREDVFNECRSQILTFIKEHPESILDSTHLEERLKKLLAFT